MSASPNPFPRLPSADPRSLRWAGMPWTPWLPFAPLTQRPLLGFDWLDQDWAHGPGVYRIRAPLREYLLYIGQTENMLRRLIDHRIAADRTWRLSQRTAVRRLQGLEWRLGTQLRSRQRIEVSWSALSSTSDLLLVEGRLIKLHEKTIGIEPKWQTLPQKYVK